MPARRPWFAPKRRGYGAGLPIAWQGWAVLATWIATVATATVLVAPHDRLGAGLLIVLACLLLVVICARRTAGGPWRWRWGSEDQSSSR